MSRYAIGARVREVCELLEIRPGSAPEELPMLPGIRYRSWQVKYMNRAVKYGLADAVMDGQHWRYSVSPNWRESALWKEAANEQRMVREAPTPTPQPVRPTLTVWRGNGNPWRALENAQTACL